MTIRCQDSWVSRLDFVPEALALVITIVVVRFDEVTELAFQAAGQEVVFQRDLVLQCLMSALNLALVLGMVRCSSNEIHTLDLEPAR